MLLAVKDLSTQMIKKAYTLTNGKLPIIGMLKALLRLHSGSIKALLRLTNGKLPIIGMRP